MKWLGRRLIEAALLLPLLTIGLSVTLRDLWRLKRTKPRGSAR